VFCPVAFFTPWPRLRRRVSPSRRDLDYDCRFRRVSIMVLRSLCGFAFHGVETPCLHSSNKHLTVVTKIKTTYRINTLPSWPRLRLCVSPSRRDWDYDCAFCHVSIMVLRSLCGFAFHDVENPWLRHVYTHWINTLPVLSPFAVFRSVAHLLQGCALYHISITVLRLPCHFAFLSSRRDWDYDCAFHHVSITVCVPWRQDAMITTRLLTSNNHDYGTITHFK
jgi:hypothetical protein